MNDDYSLLKQSTSSKKIIKNGLFSGLLHLSVFVCLIGVSTAPFERPTISRRHVMNVDLVNMPRDASPKAAKTAPETKTTPKPAPPKKSVKVPAKKPAKTQAHAKAKQTPTVRSKSKKSLKYKTYKSDKVKANKLADVEKNIEKKEKQQVEDAIARMRDKVETDKKSNQKPVKTGSESGRTSGLASDNAKEVYLHDVGYQLEKNWAFSESLAGTTRTDQLMAFVVIKVLPSGQISDYWFEKRSGNRYFDESAARAVLKSNPLPPFPEGLTEPFITMGYNFNPQK